MKIHLAVAQLFHGRADGETDMRKLITAFRNCFCERAYKRTFVNLLKPTGHVMHQQFNIQQLYVLPTLYLCVLYLSENKQRLVPLTA